MKNRVYALFCVRCQGYIRGFRKGPITIAEAKNRSEASDLLDEDAKLHDIRIHPDDGWMQIEVLELRPTKKPRTKAVKG